jgi:3-oxoacyl-[acyl-carrier protein] reductase
MLVTGAAGEIGAHLAAHFAGRGWSVVGADIRAPRAAVPGVDVRIVDLADGAAASAAFADIARTHGAMGVLVNCAGRIANAPLVALGANGWTVHDFALWDSVIASSLTTAFHASALAVKTMLEARAPGLVINVSSVCAAGNPGQAAYSAAKAGLNGLTLALAKELGPAGIRVVGLAPGYCDTASMRDSVPAARLPRVVGAVPLRRLGTLEDIAGAVDFIIANQYVNGTIVELDGGLVI